MSRLLAAAACLWVLTGCSSPGNTDALREHTADVTAAAKRDAGAIARGVAEGLSRKAPLDLNEASEGQLARLPGLSAAGAKAIVEGRPYRLTADLVHRHILSKPEFDRVRAQITVK